MQQIAKTKTYATFEKSHMIFNRIMSWDSEKLNLQLGEWNDGCSEKGERQALVKLIWVRACAPARDKWAAVSRLHRFKLTMSGIVWFWFLTPLGNALTIGMLQLQHSTTKTGIFYKKAPLYAISLITSNQVWDVL